MWLTDYLTFVISEASVSWLIPAAMLAALLLLLVLPAVVLADGYGGHGHSSHGIGTSCIVKVSNIRHEDFRASVTLRGPPLDSELGWTGELNFFEKKRFFEIF